MDMIDLNSYLDDYTNLVNTSEVRNKLGLVGEMLEAQRVNGGRLLIFGNGAASSIAGHAALDFTKQGKLRSLCFHDPALLTAFANDFGYEYIFSRQLEGLAKKGDILFAISTSGNSANVINCVKKSKEIGVKSLGLLGGTGGELAAHCDMSLIVSSTKETARIQEAHIFIGQVICRVIETNLGIEG